MSEPNRGDAFGDDDPFDDELMDENEEDWMPDGDIPGASGILAAIFIFSLILLGVAIIRGQSAKQPAESPVETAKP
jgi:hypothetical protein